MISTRRLKKYKLAAYFMQPDKSSLQTYVLSLSQTIWINFLRDRWAHNNRCEDKPSSFAYLTLRLPD